MPISQLKIGFGGNQGLQRALVPRATIAKHLANQKKDELAVIATQALEGTGYLPDVLQSSVHVQGSRDWQFDWKQLCDFADEHQLNQLTLDVNAPWIHESFHATRRRADIDRGEKKEWYSLIPLVVQGRSCGRVEIHGSHQEDFNHHDVIRNLLKITSDLEHSLIDSAANPALEEHENGKIESRPIDGVNIETAVTPR